MRCRYYRFYQRFSPFLSALILCSTDKIADSRDSHRLSIAVLFYTISTSIHHILLPFAVLLSSTPHSSLFIVPFYIIVDNCRLLGGRKHSPLSMQHLCKTNGTNGTNGTTCSAAVFVSFITIFSDFNTIPRPRLVERSEIPARYPRYPRYPRFHKSIYILYT